MASAILSTVLPEVASSAGAVYERLGTKGQTGLAAGISALGLGANAIVTLPVIIIGTIINFVIMAVIFVFTLYAKYRAQVERGVREMENPFSQALLRGLGLALAASVVLFIANLVTGGLASIVMIGVYIIAGIGYGILSLANFEFMNDVPPTEDDEEPGYTSAFRKWSITFWVTFLVGMFIAVGATLAMGVLGTKLLGDIAAPLASNLGMSGKFISGLGGKSDEL